MEFEKVEANTQGMAWYCGIYKIVCYTFHNMKPAKPYYRAYYLPNEYNNWGEGVNKLEPKTTFKQAVNACKEHAKTYVTNNFTVIRAIKLKEKHRGNK